ncbi:MAG TPA: hypothetical protein VKQ36_13220 [Ktedonobacterales bacterium]|nr:hypothetical protein [Ktedonobacterales bacterium]
MAISERQPPGADQQQSAQFVMPAMPETPDQRTLGVTSPEPWYRTRWAIRIGMALLIAGYILFWGLTAFYTVNPTDIDVFFVPDTHIALSRGFLFIYQLRVGVQYPNANGPLSMIPFTIAAWLAQQRGWLGDVYLRRMLIFAVFAPFPLLVGWEALRATDRHFARPLTGLTRIVAYGVFALTPELWHSALFYGHMEQPMEVWFVLAGVRFLAERRAAPAGIMLALALLTRSVTAVVLIPLTLILLRDALTDGDFRMRAWVNAADRARNMRAFWHAGQMLFRYLSALALTLGCVLGPFLLVDRQDTIFSLVTFRSALPVGGGNFWGLALASNWQDIAMKDDSLLTLGLATLLTLVVLAVRRNLNARSTDLYGLLALTSLCFPLLIKMFWPYYLLETYFYAALWVLASLPQLLAWYATPQEATQAQESYTGQLVIWASGWLLPVGVVASALVAEYGISANSYGGWVAPWPAVNTLLFLILMAVSLSWLLLGRQLWDWALRGILGVYLKRANALPYNQ